MKNSHLKTEEIDLLARQGSFAENPHLKSCDNCRIAVEEALFSKQAMKTLRMDEKAPQALRLKVERILNTRNDRPSFLELLKHALWVKPAFAMAGALLIVGSFSYWSYSSYLSQKDTTEDPLSMEWAVPQKPVVSHNTKLAMLTDDLEEIASSDWN